MPLALPTALHSRFDTASTNAQWASSTTVTFTAGRFYLFQYMIDRAAGGPDLSTGAVFSHGGTTRTWAFVGQAQPFGTTRTVAVWRYQALVTETVTLTWSHGTITGSNSTAGIIHEIAAGVHPVTPIRQVGSAVAASGLSVSVTLGGAPIAGNLLLALVGARAQSASINPRTNWTEYVEILGTGTAGLSGSLQGQYKATALEQTASASVASGNRTWGIVAIEIAADEDLPPDAKQANPMPARLRFNKTPGGLYLAPGAGALLRAA